MTRKNLPARGRRTQSYRDHHPHQHPVEGRRQRQSKRKTQRRRRDHGIRKIRRRRKRRRRTRGGGGGAAIAAGVLVGTLGLASSLGIYNYRFNKNRNTEDEESLSDDEDDNGDEEFSSDDDGGEAGAVVNHEGYVVNDAGAENDEEYDDDERDNLELGNLELGNSDLGNSERGKAPYYTYFVENGGELSKKQLAAEEKKLAVAIERAQEQEDRRRAHEQKLKEINRANRDVMAANRTRKIVDEITSRMNRNADNADDGLNGRISLYLQRSTAPGDQLVLIEEARKHAKLQRTRNAQYRLDQQASAAAEKQQQRERERQREQQQRERQQQREQRERQQQREQQREQQAATLRALEAALQQQRPFENNVKRKSSSSKKR